MKLSLVAATVAALVGSALAFAQDPKPTTAPTQATPDLKDLRAKASYALGQNMAKAFKLQSVDIDIELYAKGLREGSEGKGSMTEDQVKETLTAFQQQVMAKQAEVAAKRAALAKPEGEAFLKQNGTKPGVVTRPSGLQYKILTDGKGPSPKATDSVTVHYEGQLVDGNVFDSSIKRGEPASFGVSQVIRGWTEALQLMKVGSKWEVYIPADLAYGAEARPGSPIPPNSALIFNVELLGIGGDK